MRVLHTQPLSRWHPRRLWIGYASYAARPVMPLARFFMGDSHKWFFRTAATALAATYIAAVNIRFEGDGRWISYLCGFGAISVVYWLVYAPSKWAAKDNLHDPTHHSYFADQEVEHMTREDPLVSPVGQKIIHSGWPPPTPSIPPEIEVLRRYVRLNGRHEARGTYGHMRQWHPPGYWPGHLEYTVLINTIIGLVEGPPINPDLPYEDHDAYNEFLDALQEEDLDATYILATITLFLDYNAPRWRAQSLRWLQGGRRGIAKARLIEILDSVTRQLGYSTPTRKQSPYGHPPGRFRRSLWDRTREIRQSTEGRPS